MKPAYTLYEGKRVLRWIFIATFIVMAFTGFGQMPIFKRYYIADIPGFGWLAKFYVTHYIHYLGAILILGLVSYLIIDYLILQRKHLRLTASGYARGAILAGILVSGIFLVFRNLAGSRFAPEFIIFLDIAHLGLVMIFLIVSGYCRIRKKRWVTQR
jgi:uncharacterized membrane protein